MNENNPLPKNTALLVIDVQRGLFERPTPIYKAQEVLANINTVVDKARQALAPVFFIQHSNEKLLINNSDAWQLHPEIQPLDDETIIHKLHGDAFKGTDLHAELQQRNISHLVITGLVTHGCVRATSQGALRKGYKVLLVSDAHSSFSKDAPQLIEKWNQGLSEQGAALITAQDLGFG